MFDIRKYKLFVIGVLSLVVFGRVRSISISQIGDVRIVISDDKWLCDKIECPSGTYRCYVAKFKKSNDPTTLVRTNICYSKHNHALLESITTETVESNTSIKMHLNSYRSGIISSVNSYSYDSANFDEKKFNQELNNDLENMRGELDYEMSKLSKEMKHLKKGLTKMTHNLSHMFD